MSMTNRFPRYRDSALRELVPMDVIDAGFRHVGACENLEAVLHVLPNTTDAATSASPAWQS
jgi:hypothetical protein